jgi:hypothetical protein
MGASEEVAPKSFLAVELIGSEGLREGIWPCHERTVVKLSST